MSKQFTSSEKHDMNQELNKSKNRAEELLKDKEKTQKTLKEALKKAEGKKGPISKVFEDLKLMMSLVKDYISGDYRDIPYGSIVAAVGGILYFLSPIDLIPDFIPVIGYIDDVFVIGLVLRQIHGDLEVYAEWKAIK